MKKSKKMKNNEDASQASRTEKEMAYDAENGSQQSVWKRIYAKAMVTWNIIFIALFGVLLVLGVYWGLMIGTRHNKTIPVPNFIEMSLPDARKLAEELDLEIVVRDSVYEYDIAGGTVIDQMPAPSTIREVTVKPDRKIYLTVNAYSRRMVKMPLVDRKSLRQAINELERAGFNIDKLDFKYHSSAEDFVIQQRVNGNILTKTSNLSMPYGTGVTLTVGYRAKPNTTVPQLMGMRLQQAKNALWTSGLNVNKIVYDETVTDLKSRRLARVYMQTQPVKKSVSRGTKVSIYLTCDDKLIDSLSKIKDKKSHYFIEQERLMKQEADEEQRLKEEEEARLREEEERLKAEAEANPVEPTGPNGLEEIYGEDAEIVASGDTSEREDIPITVADTTKSEIAAPVEQPVQQERPASEAKAE